MWGQGKHFKAHDRNFHKLLAFLARVPSVEVNDTDHGGFGTGEENGIWWVKFSLDIYDDLAWNVVQELGFVLNYLSVEEPLPTIFKPVSPPPYLNGGPAEFLSWVIECESAHMSPDKLAQWLESRLPRPVDDPENWPNED